MSLSFMCKLLWKHWLAPIFYLHRVLRTMRSYRKYLSDWYKYSKLPSAESLHFINSYPCISDISDATPFDAHYFYQAVWAMERIVRCKATKHVDVGSDVKFVGMLTVCLPVVFVDIRPLRAKLSRLTCLKGDVLALPFSDSSVESLSCLHVAEHVGLGRYGDSLDPSGTRRACTELTRILAPGGNLFFSVPIGRPRVCFNAHRIHSPWQIVDYFKDLSLIEFSAVDDNQDLLPNIDIRRMENAAYGCGLYWFRR